MMTVSSFLAAYVLICATKSTISAVDGFSGSLVFKPHDQPALVYASGLNERSHTQHVVFTRTFAAVPQISTGLTYIDSDNTKSSIRVAVSVKRETAAGFDLTVTEWADTRLYDIYVSWMACLVP